MRDTDREIKTLQNNLTRLTNQVRWLISQMGGSLLLAQVTSNNEDGTVNVDLYANGTFDQNGNQLAVTSSINETFNSDGSVNVPGVIPEYFTGSITANTPAVGLWLAVMQISSNYYTVNAPPPPVGTGISADFFVDLFDRGDSGVLNGNWVGALNAYDVVSGAMQSVLSSAVSTAAAINKKNYIANLALTCQAPPAPDSNGYIGTGATNTYTLKFGDGGSFGINLSLWTANSADSLNTIANAATENSNADLNALNAQQSANNSVAAAKAIADNAANAILSAAQTVNEAAQSANELTHEANISAGMDPTTAYNIWFGAQEAAGAILYAAQQVNNASLSDDSTTYNSAIYANQATYNAAIATSQAAYNEALSNLEQSTYCNLSITKNGASVASAQVISPLPGVEVSTPQQTNFNLIITVNAGTITATIGDATLSYSDTSVLRNCTAFSITSMTGGNTAQIDSIKVYRGDMPEPPDQSGYGKWVSGADTPIQYKDSYHTAVKDEKGNITGYTYNPNA